MEDFLLQTDFKDPVIFKKLQTISELCHEIFITEQEILKEFLTLLLHKYDLTLSKVDSHVSKCDVGSQTDFDVQIITSETNSWNVENIADEVASIAQKNLEESGLVYDENTGLYYDHKFQCYYNPEIKLYYSYQTGAYYFYDEESQGLKFYCNASEPSNSDTTNNDNNNAKQPEEAVKCEEISKPELTNETSNETTNQSNTSDVKENDLDGEKTIEATESDEPPNSPGPVVIEAAPKAFEPDHSKHIAPCIRVIVKSSALDKLKAGTLFIVTCMGGTLGREGDRDVLIPDVLVSKLHNSFQYVYKDGIYFYEVIDVGSKNGTFLNGKRLSDSLVKSEPVEISHGSILTVGSTDLLCHIHPKDETCQDCEPYNSLKEEVTIDLSEVSLKKKHDLEVAAIRKKFGILRYSGNSQVKLAAGYEDRSDQRRKEKGSSHPSEKTQASSVDCHIEKQNKGFVLLSKMGWVEGTPLGKSPGGITEPITVREGPPLPLGLSLHTPSSQSSVRILYMIAGRCNLERWYCVNRERQPGSFDSVPIKDSIGPTFANRLNNVFIVGKGPDV